MSSNNSLIRRKIGNESLVPTERDDRTSVERFERRTRAEYLHDETVGEGRSAPGSGADATPSHASEPDPDKLIDFAQLADYLGFVVHSVGRRKWLAMATFALTLAATGGVAAVWPRTYHASAAILAQSTDSMQMLSTGRGMSPQNEGPARGAAATVLRHDNLIALIKQTNLVSEWERTRAPILKAKDAVLNRLHGKPMTVDEKMDALEGLLEQRLVVGVTLEGAVTLDIDWPDPRLAYEIVETALQNFLESRQVSETAAIAESITILERYATSLQTEVDTNLAGMAAPPARPAAAVRTKGDTAKADTAAAARAAAAMAAVTGPGDATSMADPQAAFRVAGLKAALDAKHQEIARLEEFRSQQLSSLQSQLVAARTVYTDSNPAVTSLQDSVASMSRESPQLQSLRNEAQRLESDYLTAATAQMQEENKATSAARLAAAQRDKAAQTLDPIALPASLTPPALALNPEFGSNSTVRLRLAIGQLGDIQQRLESARISLATSQAGFKFRYSVLRPAQFPRAPAKPNIALLLFAGACGAVLLAALSALGADVLSGRIQEAWQVERLAGIPVLATIRQ